MNNRASADERIAILGAGSIGTAIAEGLLRAGIFPAERIILVRRKTHLLEPLAQRGFRVSSDPRAATQESRVILVAVDPQHLDSLLTEIAPVIDPSRHVLMSVVSGAGIRQILARIGQDVPVVRAMPNTAIAIGESMTTLAALPGSQEALTLAKKIFEAVGVAVVIDEEQMVPATALCACGVAFFLRAIRAASQGGIEIGFHPSESLLMAAQTAKGAAALLLSNHQHPESEIDRVTTPRGCTIAGLNRMEHEGFSSALIQGIVLSAEKAGQLYGSKEPTEKGLH
jgi:pyrroline-5-carboxylate reductase